MDPEVQKVLKPLRDAHLLKLGLIDKSKSSRQYYSVYKEGMLYDAERKEYYTETLVPLDVSDSDYALLCQHFGETKKTESIVGDHKSTKAIAEMILNIASPILYALGVIFLIVGSILAVVEESWMIFVYGTGIAIYSTVIGAFLKMFVEMSKTLCSKK